jgi:hypothetical protein
MKRVQLGIAKQMPPLQHSTPEKPFSIFESEVVDWLTSQPEIMQLVFDIARENKCIEYDQTSRTWRGVDYGK